MWRGRGEGGGGEGGGSGGGGDSSGRTGTSGDAALSLSGFTLRNVAAKADVEVPVGGLIPFLVQSLYGGAKKVKKQMSKISRQNSF